MLWIPLSFPSQFARFFIRRPPFLIMSWRKLSCFSVTSPIIHQSESGSEPEYPQPAFQEVEKQEQEQNEEEEKEIIASPESRNEESGKREALLNLSIKYHCDVSSLLFSHQFLGCRKEKRHPAVPYGKGNHDFVFGRQLGIKTPKLKPSFVIPNRVDNASTGHHSYRIVSLEFHPSNDTVIVSGDRGGEVGIWNYGIIDGMTIYDSIHCRDVNHIKFNVTNDGTFYTLSSDGTICCTDLETGLHNTLFDLKNGPSRFGWVKLYAMDIHAEKNLVLATDSRGCIHLIDRRSRNRVGDPILIDRKRSKILGLQCNPLQPDILLSCGNDHFARIWDIRRLEYKSSLASLVHSGVVDSAYFSPNTGNKILTTCRDNRIKVWDSIFGNLKSPSRVILHSHGPSSHVTPFKAQWDPKDFSESLAVIGRCPITYYSGVAMHPIDFIDTSRGKHVAEVIEKSATEERSTVNKLHPRDDVMASGSLRFCISFIFNYDLFTFGDRIGRIQTLKRSKKQDDGCWLSSAKNEEKNYFERKKYKWIEST